jgi:hypothetical protein
MNDNFNPNKPVINNRASIITVKELTLKVLWKHQLDKALIYLINADVAFTWEPVLGIEEEHYLLTIYAWPWAINLREFAEYLEKLDFQEDH